MKKYFRLWGWTSLLFACFSILPLLEKSADQTIWASFFPNLLMWALILAVVIVILVFTRSFFYRYPQKRKQVFRTEFLFWLLLIMQTMIWFVAFLAFYPGIFGADAPSQLGMVQGVQPLSTHQPLIHTLVFGSLIQWSAQLLGSPDPGLAFYILFFQILFTAYATSEAMCSLYRRKVPAWILILSTLLLALNPFVMTLVCYTTKDILFAASLLLFAVYLSELLVPPAKQRSLITIAGKMLLWGLLMSLLRSQGLYMVACGLMIILFQYRKSLKNRRFILAEAAQMIILLVTVLVNVVLPGMGWVKKTDSREALSVPLQQIATILKENAEAEKPFLDEELSGKALSYFEDYSLEMLDPYSADNAKSKFVTEKVMESPLRFVQTWLKLVIADMPDAISAYARMIGPYFDMRTSPYNGLIVGEVPELPEKAYGIKIKSMLPEVREAISTVISQ